MNRSTRLHPSVLRRDTGLIRGKPLQSRTPLRAVSPGKAVKNAAKTRKDTGPSRKIRDLVLARDGDTCAGCGKWIGGGVTWWSLQHRKARGVGGDNSPANLIVLCGSATSQGCHRRCEDRSREMHERGLWLRSDEDPAMVPVCRFDRTRVWLSGDGRYLTEAPEAGAA